MIAFVHVKQMGCLHYYVIITHCYVIITQTSIITYYYPFQSPELADGTIFTHYCPAEIVVMLAQ